MEKTYRPLYYNDMKLFEKERKLGECTFQCPWGGGGALYCPMSIFI